MTGHKRHPDEPEIVKPAPKSSTLRMRVLRARRKAGHDSITEALIEVGRLPAWDADDKGAVERAKGQLLADYAASVTRHGTDPLADAIVASNDNREPFERNSDAEIEDADALDPGADD